MYSIGDVFPSFENSGFFMVALLFIVAVAVFAAKPAHAIAALSADVVQMLYE